MTFDPFAPVIPALMRRLAEIQRGERVSVLTERRETKDRRPAQHAGKSSASANTPGGEAAGQRRRRVPPKGRPRRID